MKDNISNPDRSIIPVIQEYEVYKKLCKSKKPNSSVFESFLADWLLPIVEPYLDPCQFGLKGASITHYLLRLLKFIHEHLDPKNPHAVVVATRDLSKAFNRVSHQMVLEDLYNMHVPTWLLLIIASYLTNRTMILTYNGATASPRNLPGSSPQGAFLGIFLFIVKYNGAALRPKIPRLALEVDQCRQSRRNCKDCSCKKHTKDTHVLYIDDLSEAEAVDLRKELIWDPIQGPYPLKYHERTHHVLPKGSILQKNLTKIENFTLSNMMKINNSKSKVMIFNKSKKYDFQSEFSFSNGENLECIEETKLLGIILSSDLSWGLNTKAIVKKAMSKMWLIRRLKSVKLDSKQFWIIIVKKSDP